jgi:rhodanese-related sulfurtransferase
MTRRWLARGTAALIMVLAVAAVSCATQELTKDDLVALLGSPDVAVIDVRSDSSLKIPGAVRENPTEVSKWAVKYSTDKTIVLYCA